MQLTPSKTRTGFIGIYRSGAGNRIVTFTGRLFRQISSGYSITDKK